MSRLRPGVRIPLFAAWIWIAAIAQSTGAPAAGDPPGDAAPQPPLLLRIPYDDPERLRQLEGSAAPPVRILPGYALAWGTEGALAELESLGFDAELLARRRPGVRWSVLDLSRRHSPGRILPPPSEFGRVLWSDTQTAVLQYDPERAPELWDVYPNLPVLDRPVRFTDPDAARARTGPAEAEPDVAGWVAEVTEESLTDAVRMLEDLESRRSFEPGAFAAAESIAARLQSYGLAEVTFFDFNGWSDNVVAVQPGTVAPEEIYVIGGHYDSTSNGGPAPGADDNATGTAAVLEAARILGREAFEATIVYIAFSGEEQGLVGSEAWAAWARSEDWDIRGMINLDMIGWRSPADAADLDVIHNFESAALKDFVFAAAATYLPDFPLVEGYLLSGNSDHASFWDQGYPAVFFHEDSDTRNPFYHSSQDRLGLSVNDLPFFRRNSQVAVAVLAELARPIRLQIAHTPLADPSPDDAGYTVTARVASRAPLVLDSLRVRFRVDGLEQPPAPLLPTAEAQIFEAVLPPQRLGALVEYEILARDEDGRSAVEPRGEGWHRFVVGRETALADAFDTDLGWVVGDPADSATAGIWERGEPIGTGPQPGEDADDDGAIACFFTGNGEPGGAAGDADVDGGRTTLTSPRLDLSGAAAWELEYARWFVDETTADDTLRVWISNDDGATWTLLEEVGESDRAWVSVRFEDLQAVLAPTAQVRVRFTAEDTGRPSLVEAAIDAVRVRVVPRPAGPPFSPAILVRAYPVPSRAGVTLEYDLAPGQSVQSLAIYDATGRRVADLRPRETEPGRHTAVWDGSIGARAAPSGVYFARLEVDGSVSTRRLLLLK